MKKYWPYAVAAAFGLVAFLLQGGAAAWNPFDTRWIPAGKDWGYHWVGWIYFRNAPWAFPLGDTPGLLWPVGTSVGFMDGLPWLSTFLKIFAPLFPENFQWVGPYIGLCFVLQGWFGARLVAAVTPSRPSQALGGCLFVLAPVLLNRIRHMALCSHFILLIALATVVRREERARLAPLVIPAVAMGIHPYITFMILGICFAAILRYRLEKLISTAGVVWRVAVMLGLVVGVAALFGYFVHGGSQVAGRGFGFYNAEILSLFNPAGMTRFLWQFPIRRGQGEGYGYVGTGVLLLGLGALVVEIRARRLGQPPLPWRRVAPLIVIAALYVVFSWASVWSVWGHDFLDASFLYPSYTGAIFRASGRFVWIAAYTLAIGAIGIWCVRLPRVAPIALAVALVVQLVDTNDVFFQKRFGGPRRAPAQSPDWQLAKGDYDHMVLFPPRCGDGGGVCCEGFTPPPLNEDMYLAVLAAHLGLTYNGFGAGRVPRAQHAVACKAVQTEVLSGGKLDPRSIYVVAREREAAFQKANPGAACKKLDAELVCVAPQAVGPFKEKLLR